MSRSISHWFKASVITRLEYLPLVHCLFMCTVLWYDAVNPIIFLLMKCWGALILTSTKKRQGMDDLFMQVFKNMPWSQTRIFVNHQRRCNFFKNIGTTVFGSGGKKWQKKKGIFNLKWKRVKIIYVKNNLLLTFWVVGISFIDIFKSIFGILNSDFIEVMLASFWHHFFNYYYTFYNTWI